MKHRLEVLILNKSKGGFVNSLRFHQLLAQALFPESRMVIKKGHLYSAVIIWKESKPFGLLSLQMPKSKQVSRWNPKRSLVITIRWQLGGVWDNENFNGMTISQAAIFQFNWILSMGERHGQWHKLLRGNSRKCGRDENLSWPSRCMFPLGIRSEPVNALLRFMSSYVVRKCLSQVKWPWFSFSTVIGHSSWFGIRR